MKTLLIIALLSLPALTQSPPPDGQPYNLPEFHAAIAELKAKTIERFAQSPPPRTQQQPQTQHRAPPSGPIYRQPQYRPPYRTPPIYYPPPRYYPRPWPSYPRYIAPYPRYIAPSGYWSWDSVQRRWVWRQSYYRGY